MRKSGAGAGHTDLALPLIFFFTGGFFTLYPLALALLLELHGGSAVSVILGKPESELAAGGGNSSIEHGLLPAAW